MSLGNLFKAAMKLAPLVVPLAPAIVAGGKAVVRSQKKGGSLNEELPVIIAGVTAAKLVVDALKKRKVS